MDSCREDEVKTVLYLCQSSLFSPVTRGSRGSLKYIPVCVQFHEMPGRKRSAFFCQISQTVLSEYLHLFENCSESKWEASHRLQAPSDWGAPQVLVPVCLQPARVDHPLMVYHVQRHQNHYYCCYGYYFGSTRIKINMNIIPKTLIFLCTKGVFLIFFISLSDLNFIHSF